MFYILTVIYVLIWCLYFVNFAKPSLHIFIYIFYKFLPFSSLIYTVMAFFKNMLDVMVHDTDYIRSKSVI